MVTKQLYLNGAEIGIISVNNPGAELTKFENLQLLLGEISDSLP